MTDHIATMMCGINIFTCWHEHCVNLEQKYGTNEQNYCKNEQNYGKNEQNYGGVNIPQTEPLGGD